MKANGSSNRIWEPSQLVVRFFIRRTRLSTVRYADRILTLDRGRLIEDGTHDELVRRGGRYATLCRLQSGIS